MSIMHAEPEMLAATAGELRRSTPLRGRKCGGGPDDGCGSAAADLRP